MSMQSLMKIGQKLLKLDSGNEALTDGQTDGRTDTQNFKIFRGYNIILRHFLCKNDKKYFYRDNILHVASCYELGS